MQRASFSAAGVQRVERPNRHFKGQIGLDKEIEASPMCRVRGNIEAWADVSASLICRKPPAR